MEIRRVKKHDVDMTSGSVFRHLLNFAVPLLMGNIFQQLYNTVDTWVVGNYVSNEAFSAVGTVAPIINTLIGAFSGLASGAGVVISQYYGAGKYDRVRDAVHTAVMMTLVLSVAFTAIGIAMTPNMLRLMKTPAEVFPESRAYLNIYFSGMAGLMLYNMGAGILRAVGDSKRPFYYLVCAAVINTVLDLVFVIAFDMGVEGVAYATIIAQGISAILTMLTLLRSESCVRVELKLIRFHKEMLLKIIKVGIPAALQMAVTAFSNIFVQSYINFFGADCMGGWTAYTKVDQLLFLPMQSIALAATTFVGQNLGKGRVDRAKQGVISYGTLFLRRLTPFYVLCCFNQVYAGALRGAGNSRAPMIIMLCSFVLFRQCYLYIMSNFVSNTVLPIALGYPAGWLVCSVLTGLYYKKVHLGKAVVVEK